MTQEFDELVSHAHETRVVVVGGGVAGLVAALECAKVGMRVTVLEGSSRLGGAVRSAEVAGIRLDTGAESYATRGGTVRALIDELGLGDKVTTPNAGGAWLVGIPGVGAAPLPAGGVLGIPPNPWAADVRRIIGWGGAWRAYLDRLRPPLTIGHEHSLGRLVRTRMGRKVLDRLVSPVTTGVYSARPDDIDADVAAPGLNNALTRTGSLSGAVTQMRGASGARPGSAIEGLAGGMSTLVDALASRLSDLGATVTTDAPVSAVTRDGDVWTVSAAIAGVDTEADLVIMAAPEDTARGLLSGTVPSLAREPGPSPVVEVVTLVLDAPALSSAPRGSGTLTVPGSYTAKALTHSTAKWSWVAEAASGHHVVRVSFGAQGEPPATAELDDARAAALALDEASAMLGVPLAAEALRGAVRERYAQAQPASALGRAGEVEAVRRAVSATPGLAVVGAWLAGAGLAQVVPDAQREADRIRRTALFHGDAASDAEPEEDDAPAQ
ncbi:protoporphyrinogen oxidase [Microbacterium sp. SSW1-59]|uniref:protoporphyrinogen oxidase n=1 Tax=Microbacterium xanthum TaxID=3079794 RepID=UPI002AD5930D|nr:protoporphyrinogen oxidase [Microbacterium sp. SSW1-59]MDZ8200957.1 protoporphyrinogen oxidase [Microbacterium sp. SSW1-59]